MAPEEPAVSSHPAPIPSAVQPQSYAFVMNVWHLPDGSTNVLAPGHELRRATPAEIAVIKDTLSKFVSTPFLYTSFWEHRWPRTGGTFEQLPEEEWRYFVIAFRGTNEIIHSLQIAFDLAPRELEMGMTFISHALDEGHGIMWDPARLFHVLQQAPFRQDFFVDVTTSDIDTITRIHNQLQQNDPRLADVKRLGSQLCQLKSLLQHSPLRFLGYFAILEALLTHAPKPSDPYDSITRQVQKKLALLDHRWAPAIDYSPFRGAQPETVWSKMYAYRSRVAHGGNPDFTGDLLALGSHDNALRLVKETTKVVMRQALAEPQLLLDLREC